MSDPVQRFIHALVRRSIAGRDDSTGKVTISHLFTLYSIFERVPIHLGYVLTDYLVHQGTHTRLKTITAGPYITRLIISMGLEEKTEGTERLQLMTGLGMSTFCQMGLVKHSGSRYILVSQSADNSEDDEESDSEDIDIPSPASELLSSTRRSRFERLEEQISDIVPPRIRFSQKANTWATQPSLSRFYALKRTQRFDPQSSRRGVL
ncbi:hypothetical protein J5N97_030028 [Dioscorea zingiberensis]|uniref:Uncharacterized protein n=1 Tax=Dioscorea zingiberensis TaxID=325984 RepID=A0A9D5BX18_9LILI|nr:hypothetical protein J5N97_030028 [Dioscorea zingiberensis]